MDIKELKKFVKWAKKQGVTSLVHGDISISFGETQAPKSKKKKTETGDPIPTTDDPLAHMPSDSDMLYWSTDAFDNIQEGRKKINGN